MATKRPRPELPRLVEQLRILLWFQMHLTVLALTILMCLVGYFSDIRDYIPDEVVMLRITAAVGLLVVIAALLATCAGLLRRWRWAAIYVLIVLTEVMAVVAVGLALATGFVISALLLPYVALVSWIVVNLARREVRAYLWGLDTDTEQAT
jgi:O-antigen/teichoic acid export membrane protein